MYKLKTNLVGGFQYIDLSEFDMSQENTVEGIYNVIDKQVSDDKLLIIKFRNNAWDIPIVKGIFYKDRERNFLGKYTIRLISTTSLDGGGAYYIWVEDDNRISYGII